MCLDNILSKQIGNKKEIFYYVIDDYILSGGFAILLSLKSIENIKQPLIPLFLKTALTLQTLPIFSKHKELICRYHLKFLKESESKKIKISATPESFCFTTLHLELP